MRDFGNNDKDKDKSPGYALVYVHVYSHTENDVNTIKLALPIGDETDLMIKQLKEKAEEEQAAVCAAELKMQEERVAELTNERAVKVNTVERKNADLVVDEERKKLEAKRDEDETSLLFADDDQPITSVEVYAWDEPIGLLELKTADRDNVNRAKAVFLELRKRGNYRRLATLNAERFKSVLNDLREEHPSFRDVVALIERQVKLSIKRKAPLHIPPILMFGDPGIGKTHFAQSLAKALGSEVFRMGFDTAVSASGLLGSDRNWGNTTSGLVFDAVCKGLFANPIILLDEVDKCRTSGGYQNPLVSLHGLLEPVTSQVEDISLSFEFNASHVIWIATCNQPLMLSPSLRSRFTEFRIELPTGADALQMARVMVRNTHKSMDLDGFKQPTDRIAHMLAHLTAREQRQALEQAYANAVANERGEIVREDFSSDVLFDEPTKGGSAGWTH